MHITEESGVITITMLPADTRLFHEDLKKIIPDTMSVAHGGAPGLMVYHDDNFIRKQLPPNSLASLIYNIPLMFNKDFNRSDFSLICGPASYVNLEKAPEDHSPSESQLKYVIPILNMYINSNPQFVPEYGSDLPTSVDKPTSFKIRVTL